MAKIINLKQARKAKDRRANRARGDANAAKHGRTTAEKEREASEIKAFRRHLDDHKREE